MFKKTTVLLMSASVIAAIASSLLPSPSVAQAIAPPTLLAQQVPKSPQSNVQELKGFKGIISSLAVSGDGQTLLVGSLVEGITALDLNSRKTLYTVPWIINLHSPIVFSANGQFFAAAQKQEMGLFRAGDGKLIRTLRGHSGTVSAIAISPDNKLIVSASGEDRTIRVWNVDNGELIETLGENVGPVTTIAFNPTGKFFATGSIAESRFIKFWDTETRKLLAPPFQQPGFVYTVAFPPSGKQLVAAVRNFVKVWDLQETPQGIEMKEISSTRVSQLDITLLALAPDGRLAAIGDKAGNVVLYGIATGKIIKTIRAHQGWVLSVAFSPDGKFLFSSGEDKIVKVWNLSP